MALHCPHTMGRSQSSLQPSDNMYGRSRRGRGNSPPGFLAALSGWAGLGWPQMLTLVFPVTMGALAQRLGRRGDRPSQG